MIRVASIFVLLPVLGAFAQSPVRITIDDSAHTTRYQIVRSTDSTTRPDARPINGVGSVVFDVPRGESSVVTVTSDSPGAAVHVRVSSSTGELSGTGSRVIVRVLRDSVSIDARDRSLPTPVRQP
jgi:hypothetical protein